MSKGFQADGQPPCKILLVGDTRQDPRALQQANANATEIARFQIAARDNAIRNGLPQSKVRRTTSTGIQLSYQYNNGLEVLLVYVPLTNLTTSGSSPQPGSGYGILAIDVLFAATPYLYQAILDPHWGDEEAGPAGAISINHTACWAVGATITTGAGLTYDMVSCSTWGASGTGSSQLSAPNQAAFGVTKTISASPRTLTHPAGAVSYQDATNSSNTGEPYYAYPLTADNIYQDMIGCTFLVHASAPGDQISIDLFLANLNSEEQSGFAPKIGIGWGSIYNIQCREFDADANLTTVNVPVQDMTHTLNLQIESTSGSGSGAFFATEYISESDAPGPSTSWSFVALDGWADSGSGAPADRTAKNMGDLLYASQDDATLPAPSFGGCVWLGRARLETTPPAPPVVGVAVPLPPYVAWDSSALRTAPTWPGSAASMEQIATIVYTSRDQPGQRGSVSVQYVGAPPVWSGDPPPVPVIVPTALFI